MGETMADRAIAGDTASASTSLPESTPLRTNCQHVVCWDGLPSVHPTVAGPYAPARRIFDLVIAGVALLFALPLLLLISALVKLQDGGPALFGQWRVGYGGRMFRRWKFRTMVVDAEDRLPTLLEQDPLLRREWEIDHKLEKDPRVTAIGSFLRASRLDELPQFFNVLGGEMSVVGPRPIVAAEIGKYDRRFKYYVHVRPGITGLWLVEGGNRESYRRRVASDEIYFRRWNFGLDLAILLGTIRVAIKSERD